MNKFLLHFGVQGIDIIILSVLHGVFEFLPISSSFFLKQFFSEEYGLFLHGICGLFSMIYFSPKIMEFFNIKFFLYAFIFCLSFVLHVFLGASVWFLVGVYCVLFFLKAFKNKIFTHHVGTLLIYLLIFTLSFLIKSSPDIDIMIHFSSVILILLGLFFNDKNKPFVYDFFDAFIIGGLVFLSGHFFLSKLGILIAYFSTKQFNIKDAVKFAFIFAGIINLMCLAFVFLQSQISWLNLHMDNSTMPEVIDLPFFILGSLIVMPLSLLVIYLFQKFPIIMVVLSCVLRIVLIVSTT